MERILRAMAKGLDEAIREGNSPTDSPEGSLTITLSDTLAKQWASMLRALADVAEAHGSSSWDLGDDLDSLTNELAAGDANRHEHQSDPLGGN